MIILGKKVKEGNLTSEFAPEESDSIITDLAENLKQTLPDVEETREHDGERLTQITLKNHETTATISHVPVDPFGEKHAEVRAVLNVKREMITDFYDTVNTNGFVVSVN